MNTFKIKTVVLWVAIGTLTAVGALPVQAEISLSQEEKDYLTQVGVIRATGLHGAAPIQYRNSRGEIKGISLSLLEWISDLTGLTFDYNLYDSISEAVENDPHIAMGLPPNYAGDTPLSLPYLKSETILFINSSVDAADLAGKTYAAVRGSPLPAGIKEEHSVYFDTREEALLAVENGKADYGYGNAYSIAFYTLQNNYKNIITIPIEKEAREYSIGFLRDDKILASIINKAIASIDERQMQALILDVTSQIERKITLPEVLETYGGEIFLAVTLIIAILTLSVVFSYRTNKQLQIQNQRYEMLSEISNEYIYEYSARNRKFKLSGKLGRLADESAVKEKLKAALFDKRYPNGQSTIRLTLDNGETAVFKSISSPIYDENKKLHSIVGKLIDQSEETAEKERLLQRSQKDGLTGLYNALTTKEMVEQRLQEKKENEIDAFLLLDLDKLKSINDTYGHLKGNEILQLTAKTLKRIFRETDIIGRVGGDEFVVYLSNIPTARGVRDRCERVHETLRRLSGGVPAASTSIGATIIPGPGRHYEEVFAEADLALYEAKDKPQKGIVIFGE